MADEHEGAMTPLPWPPAAATGIGSLPGGDARDAAHLVTGELPDFVHVVELPARGPGADAIGRTGGLLAPVGDFAIETTPDGWRLAQAAGRQVRRAVSWLGEDLDCLEQLAHEAACPVKVQIVGPWTFAAAVELASGERMLKDPMACADLAQAMAEAVRLHVADLRRRFPNADLVVQWDEPGLPAVLEGRIGTASGLSRYAPVDPQIAQAALRTVIDATRDAGALAGVHCCAAVPPIDLFRASGAQFVSIDLLRPVDDEQLGQAWEGGLGILAGCIPSVGAGAVSDRAASAPIRAAAGRLGLADERHVAAIAITPSCGLAGADPAWVRTALAACRAAGRVMRDDLGLEAGGEGVDGAVAR